jgi:23S rRNA pseudouridine1911/1915/1917 synthase
MNQKLEPKIIKETQDFLLINKPAGLVVHSDGRTDEPTVCDWVLEKYPEIEGVGEPQKLDNGEIIYRPGIVHRIDRETSGVMIITRTQEAFEYFKEQFQNHKIEKTYHAFVYGNIREDSGAINEPIGRSKKNFKQWMSGRPENLRGQVRDAVTEFKVLRRADNKDVTFIEVYPKTGRTHQIRVHMKYWENPLVCDDVYAPDRAPALGFERLALHARSIKFIAPKFVEKDGQKITEQGEEIFAEAEYPEDFKRAVKNFQ